MAKLLNGGIFMMITMMMMMIMIGGGVKESEGAATTAAPEHVVVVVMSSMGYDDIKNNTQAPYINSLLGRGVLFGDWHGMDAVVEQPNYLYLFSGTNHQVTTDSYPPAGAPFSYANLYTALAARNVSFGGYCESLNYTGDTSAGALPYSPIHNPWANFANVPAAANMPFEPRLFSTVTNPTLSGLPTVSFVIPNIFNDMKVGSIAQGDQWLRDNLGSYIDYAASHQALFVLTWDSQHAVTANHVLSLFIGGIVKAPQVVSHRLNHLSLTQTLTRMYSAADLGASATASALPSSVWLAPYKLPSNDPTPPPSGDDTGSKGMSPVLIFVTVVFSLAGFLLAGFFAVFFYRRWKKTKVEIIDQSPQTA